MFFLGRETPASIRELRMFTASALACREAPRSQRAAARHPGSKQGKPFRVNAATTSLLVFLGGGLGANARYWLGSWISGRLSGAGFPWGTALINVTGSLIIGLFMALMLRLNWSPSWRLFFAIGVLGGYTTFSSFSYDTVGLFEQGSYTAGLAYVLFNVVLSLAGCWLGISLGRLVAGVA